MLTGRSPKTCCCSTTTRTWKTTTSRTSWVWCTFTRSRRTSRSRLIFVISTAVLMAKTAPLAISSTTTAVTPRLRARSITRLGAPRLPTPWAATRSCSVTSVSTMTAALFSLTKPTSSMATVATKVPAAPAFTPSPTPLLAASSVPVKTPRTVSTPMTSPRWAYQA
ncbi:hypothetical protein D3C87_1637960 [compost metagenome]